MKIKHMLEGLSYIMSDKELQKVVRGMTNWQNHQWLRHANNHTSVAEAKKFANLERR